MDRLRGESCREQRQESRAAVHRAGHEAGRPVLVSSLYWLVALSGGIATLGAMSLDAVDSLIYFGESELNSGD